ncbi:16S rRNA (cytosine(967)-C(5))-methyltransferase RsmB [Pararobbsia silviterrae]|uniref:16S rRNA (cytosine(967)-C(5))-methyltransferase RsmB n=1 Tax=Pararobbsia silviterrae TaxID=1792498 RepID=UPI0026B447A2
MNLRKRLSVLHLAPDSLGFALDSAAQAVRAVRAGTSLPAAIAEVTRSDKAALARGAVQDVAYRTMRALATADALVARMMQKAPPEHVHDVLVCALALLVDEPGTAPAYNTFTVVDQAVHAVTARRETSFAKGLVNAVLRRFLRERDALLAAARAAEPAQWNYPQWWIDRVREAWPDHWQAILSAGNTRAPLTLRVNRRKTTPEGYLARLAEAGLEARLAGADAPDAIVLERAVPVDRLPGFFDGDVSVQDSGAQRAAPLLGATDGMRALDACAAPGGKTGHLLERATLDLVAVESSAERAPRITENLERLALAATVKVGDAAAPESWWDGTPFDRILADVPCSASGIVRRHPDIRWLRRESDIAALAAEQRRILTALWTVLAPGGELLYVTCSLFPEEGELQAQWFEAAQPDAVRLDAPGQLLPSITGVSPASDTMPGSGFDHDGFFYARFLKR